MNFASCFPSLCIVAHFKPKAESPPLVGDSQFLTTDTLTRLLHSLDSFLDKDISDLEQLGHRLGESDA